ncbi:secreted RxLR effector protein 161-like [Miscanthus floridulus]|uniref:secreted RxLR effector protein 161-like n=1 Tax=Miscanthus floridulus TaxID=154761 RepID=UPI003458036F
MEERLKLTKADTATKVDATLYRSIIGGLRYLVHTKPNIAFAVGYVSRFMEDPRENHCATVKRLLRYIKETVDHGIIFPKTDESRLQLTVFSDADMAGDIDERWSTSGVLIFLGSALISWLSLKQKQEGDAKKAPYCDTVAAAGAGAELLTYSINDMKVYEQCRWQLEEMAPVLEENKSMQASVKDLQARLLQE